MGETTIQPCTIDTRLSEDNPSTNYETATTYPMGFDSGGDNDDILIKFDLATIAKGSKIQEAKLSLYVDAVITGGVDNVACWRILESAWTEAGATWDDYDGSNAWGTAGAEQAGVDISSAYLYGPTTSSGLSGGDWFEMDLYPSEFQALIDGNNYGIKIGSSLRNGTVNRSQTFRSSEHATTATRPKLYVRWIEPSGGLYEYTFNRYDLIPVVRDSSGAIVPPEQIRVNNWIRDEAFGLPSGVVYESLINNPATNYIMGRTYDEAAGEVRMIFDVNQSAQVIMKRLTGGL